MKLRIRMDIGGRMRNKADGERGATAITVAITMLVLMGFAALALDGGIGFDDRRGTQNAADNAALAAAWESCNPQNSPADPAGVAIAVAAENGYDDSAADSSVTVTELAEHRYEVLIETTNDTTFASPGAGIDEVTVVSRAVADCDVIPFLGGYAIFAGADSSCNGGVELDLTGATKIIDGGVHSNGDLKITGNDEDTDINGPITYVGDIQPSPYPGSERLFEALDYPIDVSITEFSPGGTRAEAAADQGEYHSAVGDDIDDSWMQNNGKLDPVTGEITASGIYFTDGDIDLNNVVVANGVKVTFVSDNGQIHIRGSGDVTAYEPIVGGSNDPGLLMYSTYREPPSGPTCTGNAVQWSVSAGTWTGVIFTPYGQARQSFASNATLNGSIIAYTVNLSGSEFYIEWVNNPDAIPDFRVELEE
jgi:Flp pilus assembly protein TadG